MKYEVSILKIGSDVYSMLQQNLLILFNETAPEELKSFCLLTEDAKLKGNVIVGDNMIINDITYTVTAVGDVANENLEELGHVSLVFDGNEKAKLPGHIHLEPDFKSELLEQTKIIIK